jgi:hypothetical protein
MNQPLVWVGGEHRFRLGLGELRALQKNCDAGPEQVFNRIRLGNWRVDDLIEVLRLGLIGSGEMEAKEAGPFIARLLEVHPLVTLKLPALAVLAAALLPMEGQETEGKPEAASPDDGTSPPSTETAPSSASLPETSTE